MGHTKAFKVTRGPQYDADATIAVLELTKTAFFLRKISGIIIGKSYLAVSAFV